jgi:phosphoadenosine phosphosulfate reductase
MSVELLDELEAGELSVEFEGEEPEAVLEWAIERFAPRIAISTAFQTDNVILIDMAYKIDPEIQVFTIDTGRLPRRRSGDRELRDRYPGLDLDVLAPEATEVERMTSLKHGPNLFYERREPPALLQRAQGAAADEPASRGLDAWITGLRRDQWASRTNIRKVEIDHDHGAIVKLNPLAEWTEDEVWDYIREHDCRTPALRAGLHVDRLRAVHARDRSPARPKASTAATAAGGGSRTRRRSAASTARSRAAASSTS